MSKAKSPNQFIPYSMLCNPRKDGDGKELARELRKRLKEVLYCWGDLIRIKSCRYLSDGDIRVRMEVPDMLKQTLTDTLYANQEEMDIDIMEAGEG